jgi:DNA-binding MarR family transcriptional regulator
VTEQEINHDVLQLVVAVHRLVRSLRRAAPVDTVPPTQLIVLMQLMEGGAMRIGELAATVPCSQPTATTVVAGLESTGLVRREPDPADGRATLVSLTESGLKTVQSMALGEAAALTDRLEALTEVERQLVMAAAPLLRKLTLPTAR